MQGLLDLGVFTCLQIGFFELLELELQIVVFGCVFASDVIEFSKAVLEAVQGDTGNLDEFAMVERLAEVTGKECPAPLANLRDKKVRFTSVCKKDIPSMEKVIFDMLGI